MVKKVVILLFFQSFIFLANAEAVCEYLIWHGMTASDVGNEPPSSITDDMKAYLTIETAKDGSNNNIGIRVAIEPFVYGATALYRDNFQLYNWCGTGTNWIYGGGTLNNERILPFTETSRFPDTTEGTTISFNASIYWTVSETDPGANNRNINKIPFSINIGDVCTPHSEPPVFEITPTFVKGGEKCALVTTRISDTKWLKSCYLEDETGTWTSEEIDLTGFAKLQSGSLNFSWTDAFSLTETPTRLRVVALDVKDNIAKSDFFDAVKNTEGPTMESATLVTAKSNSVTIKVTSTPSTGGNVFQYQVVNGSKKTNCLINGNSEIVVDGLNPETNYILKIFAVDETGNISTNSVSLNVTTFEYVSPYCGYFLNPHNSNRNQLNSYAFAWISKTGAEEMTVLFTHYPGTAPLSGLTMNINGARKNNNGQISFVLKPHDSGDITKAAVTNADFGVGTYRYKLVDVSFDNGKTTQKAVQLVFTGNFNNMTNGIYFNWQKWYSWDNSNNSHNHRIENSEISFDNLTNCVINTNSNGVLLLDPIEWVEGDDGSPYELDAPSEMKQNAVASDYITGNSCANQMPPTVVWGTSFSPVETGKFTAGIDEIEIKDMSAKSEFLISNEYVNVYKNGGFMSNDDGERKYAIVNNPKSLDSTLARRNDEVNRLVVKMPTIKDEEELFTLYLEGFTLMSDVTVKFDLELLNKACYIPENTETSVNLRVAMNKTKQSFNNLTVDSKTTVSMTEMPNESGAVLIRVMVQRSLDCQAIAISNLRVYGCMDKKIVTIDGMCEGKEIELTALGMGKQGKYVWEVSDNGADWTEVAQTTENVLKVIPELFVTKLYRVKKSSGIDTDYSDVASITGEICCDNGESIVVWSEDFSIPEIANNNKHADWLEDNGDKIVKNHGYVPGENAGVVDGHYAVTSNTSAIRNGTGILADRYDHTSNDGSGGFLFVNVGATAVNALLFEKLITGFCEEIPYNFSLWLLQVEGYGVDANLRFEIEAELTDGTNKILVNRPTGTIMKETNDDNDQWRKYGVSFTVPKNTDKLYLRVYNFSSSGDGNDLCFDDLVLSACQPTLSIVGDHEGTVLVDEAKVNCGEKVKLDVAFNGSEETYFDVANGPYYLWQYRLDDTSDWLTIEATTPGTGSGIGSDYNYYDILSVDDLTNGYYRVIVAQTADLAQDVANEVPLTCANIYGISEPYLVSCDNPIIYPIVELVPRVGSEVVGPKIDVDCGTDVLLASSLTNGRPADFFDIKTGPYYLWQFLPADSTSWTNIAEGEIGKSSGSGVVYKTIMVETNEGETDGQYRIVIAQTKEVTELVGAGKLPGTRNYAISKPVTIHCKHIEPAPEPCDLPKISLSPSNEVTVTLGTSVELSALVEQGEKVVLTWKNNEGVVQIDSLLNVSDKSEVSAMSYSQNTYIVSSENICGRGNEETVVIKVVYPTIITPHNLDGKNDTFITGYDAHIQVFSRFGHTVYEGDDGWDGTYKGQPADPGVYYYIATFPNGEQKKGTVQVVKNSK